MDRQRGLVVSFSRGYGFITTGATIDDDKAARYFFHANDVEGSSESLTTGKMVTFRVIRGKGDRLAAGSVRDAHGSEIGFKRTANVNMNVSSPGRRVGIVAPNPSAKFCFAIDQSNGERVFIPIPLSRGQQIEYTLEMTDRGAAGTDVSGPMGAPLQRAKPGHGVAPVEAKPQAKPIPKKQPKLSYMTEDEYYDDIDYKYM